MAQLQYTGPHVRGRMYDWDCTVHLQINSLLVASGLWGLGCDRYSFFFFFTFLRMCDESACPPFSTSPTTARTHTWTHTNMNTHMADTQARQSLARVAPTPTILRCDCVVPALLGLVGGERLDCVALNSSALRYTHTSLLGKVWWAKVEVKIENMEI